MFKTLPAVWLVSIFSLSTIAAAQTAVSATPVPEPQQATLAPVYRSAFEGYKPFTDEKIVNWKEANDTTGRIGGWRVYAKEASQPGGVSQPPASATQPAPQAESSKP